MKSTVAVAMSGGVDSSVAAAMLVDQGMDVIGIMMRLWSHEKVTNRCCSPDDIAIARRISAQLDIPFYVLDAQERFKTQVVDFFVQGYSQGVTPNPCVECNRHIRWEYLLEYAQALGASKVATGHYARVIEENGQFHLRRGLDPRKDQSYILSMLTQEQLSHALFPLGDLTKDEVRTLARDYSLPVAEKSDSQDLCFVGNLGYRQFLMEQDPGIVSPGPMLNLQGDVIGEHHGLANYTIGQRKGIGISAPDPLYVISKNVGENALVIGPKEALSQSQFTIDQVNWIHGKAPAETVQLGVQIRYQAKEVPAKVDVQDGFQVLVTLDDPLPDVTPGQLATFYTENLCLGGGIIRS
jgi:tRNA-specific 2-thiouridylase